jgi:hypothetical protein
VGLSALVPDEQGIEYERALDAEQVAQNTDTPSPLFGVSILYGAIGYNGLTAAASVTTCPEYTDDYTFTQGNPPYPYATDPTSIWYAADFDGHNYAGEIFLKDPR